jgi:Domain of unknown function (DUF6702)
MNLIRITFFLFLVPLLMSADLHKFYVSTTKVEYVQEKKSLQIISKIFIDDLQDLLRERYDPNISLASEQERKVDEEYMKEYVLKKLKIRLDEKEIKLQYIGREYENDLVKIYLEAIPVIDFQTIEVENKILFELSSEQQNIVHVKHHDQRKSLVLDLNNPNGLLKFDEFKKK